jgi:cyclopropane-fatty-acyl-phospholipid synthase
MTQTSSRPSSAPAGGARRGVADALLGAIGTGMPLRLTAYDGSAAGPTDAPIQLHLASARGIRRILTAPGSLGLARAYVGGDLLFDGDVYEALVLMAQQNMGQVPWSRRLEALRELGVSNLRPVPPPPEEVGRGARLRLGRKHAKRRDAAAISHHYDVSNRFYEMVLGPSMAYTCAVFPKLESSLEEAQYEKHDLVARKLALRPGMRLLDVGCGWGGMVRHAAREYGVKALGVTLSRKQAEWAQAEIEREGLADLAQVRFSDYRDVDESGFDAISSIGLTEHIGQSQLVPYVRTLRSKLRPEGRLLNHCITRPTTKEPPIAKRGFINSYVFPDGELLGAGTIISAIQDHGFEVRHEENLREHYALTLAGWCDNLARHWKECVAEVGIGTARVWQVYLAGSRLAFERGDIELHQVLAVRPDRGRSGMPLRPDW